jgi:transcriptional regulator with XRE-family HTH domain
MEEPTTLGAYLRRERERRNLTLRTISESTKVSLPLLEGLEADDISRWPGGIFRRAFVRSYAECVGLDPDDVHRRFEKQHQPEAASSDPIVAAAATLATPQSPRALPVPPAAASVSPAKRARVLGTAGDLTVAMILAFGSAAAGSRLLWPVLLIAGYYAIGVLLTGTSPMVALLGEDTTVPATPPAREPVPAAAAARPGERRHQPRRTNERPRQRRGAQQVRAQ